MVHLVIFLQDHLAQTGKAKGLRSLDRANLKESLNLLLSDTSNH